jgi:hypothetical protein
VPVYFYEIVFFTAWLVSFRVIRVVTVCPCLTGYDRVSGMSFFHYDRVRGTILTRVCVVCVHRVRMSKTLMLT